MKAKPPIYALAALAAMLSLHLLVPVARIVPPPWNLLGYAPLFSGAALVFLSLLTFRRNRTTAHPAGVPAALVTDGPYRFSRNPMYLGILLMTAGGACLFGTLTPWLVPPVLGVALDVGVIRAEERRLERLFGGEYRAYKAGVRRWM